MSGAWTGLEPALPADGTWWQECIRWAVLLVVCGALIAFAVWQS